MSKQMEFPETFEKFAEEYGFKDEKEIYTNGSDLIPIFRVKQWLEHDNKLRTIEIETAYECGKHSNKPCEDCVSRQEVEYMITNGKYPNENDEQFIDRLVEELEKLSPVTPARKKGKWEYVGDNCFKCTECGEVYTSDQLDHINNYCDNSFPKGCPHCGTEMESGE